MLYGTAAAARTVVVTFRRELDVSARTAIDPKALLAVEDPELLLDAVIVTDPAGVITAVNRAFTRLHRYAPGEVVGARPRKLASGLQSADDVRELWETISTGDVWDGELVDRGGDGTLRTVRTRITPVRDPSGAICHYVAIQREVRPRGTADEGHLRLDITGRCTYADPIAARLLHRDADPLALLGDGLLRALQAEDAEAVLEVAERAAELGRTTYLDLPGSDGYVRCRVHPDAAAREFTGGAVVHITCAPLTV